jgi:hypothetical protein
MEREHPSVWTKVVYSAALGALAMYVFDPDKGKRRRAVGRDKARSFLLDTRDAVGVTRRDVAHRLEGLRARARRLLSHQPAPDDLQLIERVRARMGRLVSHPHAVQVGARRGKVTLSGPILAREVAPLLASIHNVWGVSEVEDRLVAYERAENIPSLQGERRAMAGAAAAAEYWPPALRGAAVVGGALLTLRGTQRGSLAGSVLILAGLGLAVRAIVNRSWSTLAERALGTSSAARFPLVPKPDSEPGVHGVQAARRNGGPSIYDFPSVGSALH